MKYAIPKTSAEETLGEIDEVTAGRELKTQIVDHMSLGKVVRVEADEETLVELYGLSSIARLADSLEGKIELGVFVKEEKPEFTASLRRIIESSGGR